MRETTNDPIEFCPAAACAAAIVRLETFADQVARLLGEARGRLAEVEAVSAAGAMAQLLAAIRDVRVRDDAERERAKDLEAKAVRCLGDARLFDARFCGLLSHTKLGRRLVRPALTIEQLEARLS